MYDMLAVKISEQRSIVTKFGFLEMPLTGAARSIVDVHIQPGCFIS